jgi:hypothetical protein
MLRSIGPVGDPGPTMSSTGRSRSGASSSWSASCPSSRFGGGDTTGCLRVLLEPLQNPLMPLARLISLQVPMLVFLV